MGNWRVGRSVGRTIYDETGQLIGMMDTELLAGVVVNAHNETEQLRGRLVDIVKQRDGLHANIDSLREQLDDSYTQRENLKSEAVELRKRVAELESKVAAAKSSTAEKLSFDERMKLAWLCDRLASPSVATSPAISRNYQVRVVAVEQREAEELLRLLRNVLYVNPH